MGAVRAARPRRSTPARGVVTLLAGVAVVCLVATVVAMAQRPQLLAGSIPGVHDCPVDDGETEIGLSTAEAESAADVAARSVRLDLPRGTTTAALSGDLDLSPAEADAVARVLKGAHAAGLSCLHGGATEEESDELDDSGLTARAAAVRDAVEESFGDQQLGGFAPGGVSDGHMPGSAHYDGRAVDVFFRPVTDDNLRRGWAVAHWLVAHAERLDIETVIFDRQIWTHRRAVQGWRPYEPDTSGRSADVAEILEHRDHVHVDVAD